MRDVTYLNRTDGDLQESETRLRQILDNATAVMYGKDRDGRYLFVNRQFLRVFGMREADIVGKLDHEVFPRAVGDAFRHNDLRVLATNAPIEFEETARLEDGEHTYISLKFPLFNRDGETCGVCGISTDITERKRIEEALRNVALAVSGARGSDIFQILVRFLATTLNVDFAIIAKLVEGQRLQTLAIFDQGKIIDNMAYDLGGTPCQRVVGHQFHYVAAGIQVLYPGANMLKQLGFEGYAGYPLFGSQGDSLGLIAITHRRALRDREVTESVMKIFSARAAAELERLQADEARRISEHSYRTIFEASEDAIFVHDIGTGAIVDVNPKACAAYGYSYEEMLRLNVGDISSGVHPYTIEGIAKFIQKAKDGERPRFEWHRRNKDGSLHWDEVYLKRAAIGGVDRILAFTREITERKRAEEERARLEAQLRQAQKMEAIGHLAGGIAHDFNNILTSIMGYIVLAAERVERYRDDKLAKYLDRAQRSGQRARDLIQQMLTFSRGQRGEPRPLALVSLIKESIKLLGSTFPSTVELQTALDPSVPSVMLDPVHVEQVLMNLCINARDAMRSHGRITIGLRQVAYDQAVCASCRQAFNGSFVELAISDTGPGIAPAVVERMFEPFYTTKEVGQGSGMGLAVVHGIVHEYGGHLLVETAPDAGAMFRVLFKALPAAEAGQGEAASETNAAGSDRRLRGRVLVVDDELAVGEFMQDMLESWGLAVTVYSSSPEARDSFARNPQHFDLVVLDQTMPRMTGLDLAQAILGLSPEMPVILYTGHREALTEQQVKALGIRALVRKPVDVGEFFTLVSSLLPAGTASDR